MLMKKELIENNKILLWENRKQKEEIERLNNVINGVEDLLKRFKCSYREIPIQIVLNEIRELKGDDKE